MYCLNCVLGHLHTPSQQFSLYKTIEIDVFLFVLAYGFDKLEQRETCLIQWFYSLRKFAVMVCAGGLKKKSRVAFVDECRSYLTFVKIRGI